jgi:hypothetical protein
MFLQSLKTVTIFNKISFLQTFANLDGMAAAGIAIYSKMMIWELSKKRKESALQRMPFLPKFASPFLPSDLS